MSRKSALGLLLCLAPITVWSCSADTPPAEESVGQARSALGGLEGTFEAALDAPWRIEPALESPGGSSGYGAIPIQLTIHDADLAGADHGYWTPDGFVATNPKLGHFCEIIIEQEGDGEIFHERKHLSDLTEIEATIGPWTPGGAPPPHHVCKPAIESCDDLVDIGPTSEWHAGTWYYPQGNLEPGQDIPLTLTARITRDPEKSCESEDEWDYLTITNRVRVHLGEAPLPRFDNRWIYGDLHYHSQGTDNEGEAGYNFRGVVRALGAMGVDFAVASDHASASEQIVDADVNVYPFYVEIETTGGVLRDMNSTRFNMLQHEIWKADGVNADALLGPSGLPPQGYQSHGVVPRIFLGGEVDVIPEISNGWNGESYSFGNGLRWDLDNLCGGWFYSWITIDGDCDRDELREDAGNRVLIKDHQGMHDYGFARSHLVYLPRRSSDQDQFIGSFTGRYGGGGRRLTEMFKGREPVLTEIERKGFTFLAHPVPVGSCPDEDYGGARPNGASLRADLEGSPGPDVAPYTQTMLSDAFRSSAVLGLQFWNENTRLCTNLGEGDSSEFGFDGPGSYAFKKRERYGFQTGKFGLDPYFVTETGEFQHTSTGVEWTLHHGAKQWDDMLLLGINPVATATLGWVLPNKPRRVFMAGGSDAHGDFNYRREGYMTGTTRISDTAIAKVRNLVFAGTPDESTPEVPVMTYSQGKVFQAMREGNFSVTDGPALRIVIDYNGNGVIDDSDIPMGGHLELHGNETTIPLLVQWMSTPEFGPVDSIQLYVGVEAGEGDGEGNEVTSVTYAVRGHGPQSEGIALSDTESSYVSNGVPYYRMRDGYMADPTGLLSITPASGMSGVQMVNLPIAAFQAGPGVAPERMYVRAFARTVEKDADRCAGDPVAVRRGACIRRYAFTNPVWVMPTDDGPIL